MKVKVGTLLDSDLLRKAKVFAADRGMPLNQLIESALESYVRQGGTKELLSLKEVLSAQPGSRSQEGKGRGEGDFCG